MCIASMMLMISGCASVTASKNVCPQPLIPTVQEQTVLRDNIPNFYVKFTNQQADLFELVD